MARRPSIDRRTFLRRAGVAGLALGAGPTLLAACGSDDDTSEASGGGDGAATGLGSLDLQLNWITNAEFAGTYVAVEEGYYANNGIEPVTVVPGGPDVAVEPAVVAGSSMMAYTISESMSGAVAEGADLKVIGAGFQNNPFGVMSMADDPILSPQDMVGRSIGDFGFELYQQLLITTGEALANDRELLVAAVFYMAEEDIAANVATLESIGLPIDPSVYTTEVLDEVYADGISLLG